MRSIEACKVVVNVDQSRPVPSLATRAAASTPCLSASLSSPVLQVCSRRHPICSDNTPTHAIERANTNGFRRPAFARHYHQEVRRRRAPRCAASPSDGLCRLEATTSRLEDLASLATSYLPPSAQAAASTVNPASSANAEPTPVPPPPPPPPTTIAPPAEDPKSVVAFDEQIIEGKLKPFVELTKGFSCQALVDQVRPMSYRSGTRH